MTEFDDFLRRVGLTPEALTQARLEEFSRSFGMQSAAERTRRLTYVRQLSAALDKIEAVDRFSTGLGAFAIEAVINGETDQVRFYAQELTFVEDPDLQRRYGPLWQEFTAILLSAAQTSDPKAGPQA